MQTGGFVQAQLGMVYYTDTLGSIAYMDKTYTCLEFFTFVYAHAATCN